MTSRRKFINPFTALLPGLLLSVNICISNSLLATTNKECKKFDGLYYEIAKDLIQGKPLIITNYLGLWIDNKPPAKNLYWGNLYGHKSMFDRSNSDQHIKTNFTNYEWEEIYSENNKNDPLEILIYRIEIDPNENWKKHGVEKPFIIYQVYIVFKDIYKAGFEMFLNLKQDKGRKIEISGNILDLGSDSRIVGYIGHNFLMDNVINNKVDMLKKTTTKIKGSFAIGCSTSSYFKHLTEEGLYNLLYTTGFMAPEGYVSLAFVDAIALGMSGKSLAKHCDKAYKYFQILGGQKKPGPLFVNHEYKMFK
jgi:hypothetical protein